MTIERLHDKRGAPAEVTKGVDRFVIAVEEGKAALTMFRDRDSDRIFFHTEAKDEFRGRGLATLLIGEALRATRGEGLRIVPVCPLVAAYVDKHDEFADIVVRPTRDHLTWLERQLGP